MIYIIVGNSCSGKTTARQYFEQCKLIPGFEASEFFKSAMMEHQALSPQKLFQKLGKDFVAKEISARNHDKLSAVISGFRTVEEVQYMKSRNSCFVIGIYASEASCFKRAQNRGRDYYSDFFDFYKRKICSDYALGLASILSQADFMVNNDYNIETFKKSLDDILGRVK